MLKQIIYGCPLVMTHYFGSMQISYDYQCCMKKDCFSKIKLNNFYLFMRFNFYYEAFQFNEEITKISSKSISIILGGRIPRVRTKGPLRFMTRIHQQPDHWTKLSPSYLLESFKEQKTKTLEGWASCNGGWEVITHYPLHL